MYISELINHNTSFNIKTPQTAEKVRESSEFDTYLSAAAVTKTREDMNILTESGKGLQMNTENSSFNSSGINTSDLLNQILSFKGNT